MGAVPTSVPSARQLHPDAPLSAIDPIIDCRSVQRQNTAGARADLRFHRRRSDGGHVEIRRCRHDLAAGRRARGQQVLHQSRRILDRLCSRYRRPCLRRGADPTLRVQRHWHILAPRRQLPPSLLRTGDIVVRPALSDAQYIYVISGNGAGAYDARAATWSWKIFPYYSSFGSLAVDPQDRATAYLGRLSSHYADASGDHFANNHTGGIDKTTDGGASWTPLTS